MKKRSLAPAGIVVLEILAALTLVLGLTAVISDSRAHADEETYTPLRYVYDDKRNLTDKLSAVSVPYATYGNENTYAAAAVASSAAAEPPNLSNVSELYVQACWYEHSVAEIQRGQNLDQVGGRCLPFDRLEVISANEEGQSYVRIVPTEFYSNERSAGDDSIPVPEIELLIPAETARGEIAKHAVFEFVNTSNFCIIDYELTAADVNNAGLALKIPGAVQLSNGVLRQRIARLDGNCAAQLTATTYRDFEPQFHASLDDKNPSTAKLYRYHDVTEQNLPLREQGITLAPNGDISSKARTRQILNINTTSNYSRVVASAYSKAAKRIVSAVVDHPDSTYDPANSDGFKGNPPFVRKIFETSDPSNCTINGNTSQDCDFYRDHTTTASGSGGGCDSGASQCVNPKNAPSLALTGDVQSKSVSVYIDHVENARQRLNNINNFFASEVDINGQSFPLLYISPCQKFQGNCRLLWDNVGGRNYYDLFNDFVRQLNAPIASGGYIGEVFRQEVESGPNAGSTISVKIERVVPAAFPKTILDQADIRGIQSYSGRGYSGSTDSYYGKPSRFSNYTSYTDTNTYDMFTFSTRVSVTITNPVEVNTDVKVYYSSSGNSHIKAVGTIGVEDYGDEPAQNSNSVAVYGRHLTSAGAEIERGWYPLCGSLSCPNRGFLFPQGALPAEMSRINATVNNDDINGVQTAFNYRFQNGYVAKQTGGQSTITFLSNSGIKNLIINDSQSSGFVGFYKKSENTGSLSLSKIGRAPRNLSTGTVNNFIPQVQLQQFKVSRVRAVNADGAYGESDLTDTVNNINVANNSTFTAPSASVRMPSGELTKSWKLMWANAAGKTTEVAKDLKGNAYDKIYPGQNININEIQGLTTQTGKQIEDHNQLIFVPSVSLIDANVPYVYAVGQSIYANSAYRHVETKRLFWGMPGLIARIKPTDVPRDNDTYSDGNVSYPYKSQFSVLSATLQQPNESGDNTRATSTAGPLAFVFSKEEPPIRLTVQYNKQDVTNQLPFFTQSLAPGYVSQIRKTTYSSFLYTINDGVTKERIEPNPYELYTSGLGQWRQKPWQCTRKDASNGVISLESGDEVTCSQDLDTANFAVYGWDIQNNIKPTITVTGKTSTTNPFWTNANGTGVKNTLLASRVEFPTSYPFTDLTSAQSSTQLQRIKPDSVITATLTQPGGTLSYKLQRWVGDDAQLIVANNWQTINNTVTNWQDVAPDTDIKVASQKWTLLRVVPKDATVQVANKVARPVEPAGFDGTGTYTVSGIQLTAVNSPISFANNGKISASQDAQTDKVSVRPGVATKLTVDSGTGVGAFSAPTSDSWKCKYGSTAVQATAKENSVEFTPQAGLDYLCEYSQGYNNISVVTNYIASNSAYDATRIGTEVQIVDRDQKELASTDTYLEDDVDQNNQIRKTNSLTWFGRTVNPLKSPSKNNNNENRVMVKRLQPGQYVKLTPAINADRQAGSVRYKIYRYVGGDTQLGGLNVGQPTLTDTYTWRYVGATDATNRSVFDSEQITPGNFVLYLVQGYDAPATLTVVGKTTQLSPEPVENPVSTESGDIKFTVTQGQTAFSPTGTGGKTYELAPGTYSVQSQYTAKPWWQPTSAGLVCTEGASNNEVAVTDGSLTLASNKHYTCTVNYTSSQAGLVKTAGTGITAEQLAALQLQTQLLAADDSSGAEFENQNGYFDSQAALNAAVNTSFGADTYRNVTREVKPGTNIKVKLIVPTSDNDKYGFKLQRYTGNTPVFSAAQDAATADGWEDITTTTKVNGETAQLFGDTVFAPSAQTYTLYRVVVEQAQATIKFYLDLDPNISGMAAAVNPSPSGRTLGEGFRINLQKVTQDSSTDAENLAVNYRFGKQSGGVHAVTAINVRDNSDTITVRAGDYKVNLFNNIEGFGLTSDGWNCSTGSETTDRIKVNNTDGIPKHILGSFTVPAGKNVSCVGHLTTAPVAVIFDEEAKNAGVTATFTARIRPQYTDYFKFSDSTPGKESEVTFNKRPIYADEAQAVNRKAIRRAAPASNGILDINFGTATGKIVLLQRYTKGFTGELPETLSPDNWETISTRGIKKGQHGSTTTCILPPRKVEGAAEKACVGRENVDGVTVLGMSRLFSPAVAGAAEVELSDNITLDPGVLTVYRVSLIDPPAISLPLTGGTATDLFIALSGIFMVLGVGAGYVHRRKQKGAIIMRT